MITTGEIQDAKTVLLLQWAALNLPWPAAEGHSVEGGTHA